ncbi:MAG TPA: hypothetical protein VGR26_12340 [Acidimicrobiales bacterium]|nr:hypothetical protein [Acidimicrobiales bacterium]
MTNVNLSMGVDLGKVRDPSAIVVVEGVWHRISQGGHPVEVEAYNQDRGHFTLESYSGDTARLEAHYHVRHISRLELGTPYPVVVDTVIDIAQALGVYEGLVDATGIGGPVMDLFDEARRERGRYPSRLQGIVLTGGERSSPGNIAKVDLVGAIQRRLSTKAVHYGGLPLSTKLHQELADYRVRITERGNDRYGSVTESAHDDLVIAFGLALLAARRRPTDTARVIEIRQPATV